MKKVNPRNPSGSKTVSSLQIAGTVVDRLLTLDPHDAPVKAGFDAK
jgi:hypothetical protein